VDLTILQPRVEFLLIAVALDLIFGDPVYPLHPIRLMGLTLTGLEKLLRAVRLDGYIGGCLLFLLLAVLWVGIFSFAAIGLLGLYPLAGQGFHAFTLYSMIALGDLFKHGRDVDQAVSQGNLQRARLAVAKLVGRDVDQMDGRACRRAAIESLAESLVDGFASPILFYAFAGLPGVVLFKVASTMDSMVGYKREPYLRFGWCGARLDDLANLIPARLAWLLLTAAASLIPGCSAGKAWRIGLRQHSIIPGPNAGWSEAGMAGALERRLIGPIWRDGSLVTDTWIGEPSDREGGSAPDYRNAHRITSAAAALFVLAAALLIRALSGR
jgi:adenosylcobinamide-phosphate synthase